MTSAVLLDLTPLADWIIPAGHFHWCPMIYLVSLFWLCVFGYIPYHYRNTKTVKAFVAGNYLPWYVVITAKEPEHDQWEENETPFAFGLITGMASIVVLLVATIIFALFTIRLCR